MDRLELGRVILAVSDAGAGSHPLHFATLDHRAGAQAIPVRQSTFEDISENLHVAVKMGGETGARLHPIVVDDAERTETHVGWVVVIRERKCVAAVQPVEQRPAALFSLSNDNQSLLLTLFPARARRPVLGFRTGMHRQKANPARLAGVRS